MIIGKKDYEMSLNVERSKFVSTGTISFKNFFDVPKIVWTEFSKCIHFASRLTSPLSVDTFSISVWKAGAIIRQPILRERYKEKSIKLVNKKNLLVSYG